ncbi:hypothetical protein PHLCEN_2v11527 [Hermanssonia centrifuga]|uniref:Uncharacterized protein n=1 Tax=Hermanssonia centrifuga TaxID=98765 RepID=A0A2R6NJS2_9APHY|nr:hypothetical protein PHLCEN_2v11527 [Hermanssonia centrifuga]
MVLYVGHAIKHKPSRTTGRRRSSSSSIAPFGFSNFSIAGPAFGIGCPFPSGSDRSDLAIHPAGDPPFNLSDEAFKGLLHDIHTESASEIASIEADSDDVSDITLGDDLGCGDVEADANEGAWNLPNLPGPFDETQDIGNTEYPCRSDISDVQSQGGSAYDADESDDEDIVLDFLGRRAHCQVKL